LIILMRFTWPSTGPELHGSLSPCGDRVKVALQPGDERVQAGQVAGQHVGNPLLQVPAGQVLHHLGELPDVSGDGGQRRAARHQPLQVLTMLGGCPGR
jgi:hypothetical protein